MQRTYISTVEIKQYLGCSGETARRIARQIPHLQIGRGRGAMLRVKAEDFKEYIESNTVMPGELELRSAHIDTTSQLAREAEVKEWHKRKHRTQAVSK